MVHQDFFSLGLDGIIDTDKYLASAKAGGHAVSLVGWKTINGKLYWELQNSWGKFFGNFGYFFMEHDLFKKVIINSVGPYYLEFSDGYFNPGPDPEPVEPDPVEPDPVEPDPVEPDPVEPEPKDNNWLTPKMAWIVFGVMVLIILTSLFI